MQRQDVCHLHLSFSVPHPVMCPSRLSFWAPDSYMHNIKVPLFSFVPKAFKTHNVCIKTPDNETLSAWFTFSEPYLPTQLTSLPSPAGPTGFARWCFTPAHQFSPFLTAPVLPLHHFITTVCPAPFGTLICRSLKSHIALSSLSAINDSAHLPVSPTSSTPPTKQTLPLSQPSSQTSALNLWRKTNASEPRTFPPSQLSRDIHVFNHASLVEGKQFVASLVLLK